jgi:hypothetical protein
VLKCFALAPRRADEGIYFYDAWRLAHGARLYRDLFFAHPPLGLVPPLLLALVHGGVGAMKAIPNLAGAAQGLFAYLIGRRALKSELAGVVACFLVLYSEDFLKSTSYSTDISLADALLWCGVYLLLMHRRALAGGIVAAAGTMTLLQTAPAAAVVGVAALLYDRKLGLRFAAGAAITIAAAHLIGLALGGGAFLTQVYVYHLHKAAREDVHILANLIVENLPLFGCGAIAISLSQGGNEPDRDTRRFVAVCGLVAAVQIVAMATRPVIFPFYFQPAFLPLALAVGWVAARAAALIRTRERRNLIVAGALIAAVLAPRVFIDQITDAIAPTRAQQRRTYAQTYTWKDAPLIGPLNLVVQSLFWHDGVRVPGTMYSPVTDYLWNFSRGFDSYDAIVDAVREAGPDATLFGESLSAPLVAFGAGVRIPADVADTNVNRYTSGTTSVEETIAAVDAHGGPTLLLSVGNFGLFGLPGIQEWRDAHYAPLREFTDGDGTHYTVWKRR